MTQVVIEGFLLSRQTVTTNGKTYVVLWLSSSQGPIKVISEPQPAVLFILNKHVERAQRILRTNRIASTFRTLNLKHFNGEAVSACYFDVLNEFYTARALLEESLPIYEDDVRVADRFLMERFIKGGVWAAGEMTVKHSYIEIRNAKVKPNERYVPELSVVSLDIECSISGVLYCVGLKGEFGNKVIMIGDNSDAAVNGELEWVKDEIALFERLNGFFQQLDPDIIIGWNVIEFDFRVLKERADALGIVLNIGRNNEPVYLQQGQFVKLTVPGRVVLDGIDTLKNATYQFESFKLNRVAGEVLGENKLISHDDRMEEINRLFKEDKQALALYNLQDCDLVLKIFDKLHLLEFAIRRVQLTGLELERKGGSVVAFTNLYLPLLHRSGYIAPNLGEHGLSFDSPGGYVMDSKPGLYQNVIVLDFKSLYPSIIRTFLIDPLGLILGLANDNSENTIEGFNHAQFSRIDHHLPSLVATLGEAREKAKSEKDAQLSQAIKIIMNSLYGVLGSKGCRFYDPRLSSSITLRGHEIMQQTRHWIEEMGYEVIYGDTDSTFVNLSEHLEHQDCVRIGERIVEKINHNWRCELQQRYRLESHLELEFEVHYQPFFMPTIRHLATGSKKRYVGKVAGSSDKDLVFKGMETVRSDWTKLAHLFQQELFVSLFETKMLADIYLRYKNKLTAGEFDELLIYKKRMQQSLELYTKNIPPHIKALKQAIANGEISIPKPGFMVEYVQTMQGPRLFPSLISIDYNYYIEKQLNPIFDMVKAFDLSSTSVDAQQVLSF
ncbi:DNA polymerase II [Pseudoalteromonas xiamenensis]|uniref:DNA polymerase n=1 Tax=Pseudoalteromonas xiamenensis TaxID=882626 RepID=A0A975HKV2_9GAMM|nr:DNA polymerase II [Pseudoalteromonas xiamenensis]QTH71423.1 DNA polymerase II [Pseudoalteromonas xiamenensis]